MDVTDIVNNHLGGSNKINNYGFITNRLYRILIRIQLDGGRYRIFDDNFDFKVVS